MFVDKAMDSEEITQNPLPGIPVESVQPIDQKHTTEMRLFEHLLAEQGVPWQDEYAYFRAKGFTFREAAVIAWLCMPKKQRIPATKAELAEMLGLAGTVTIRKIELKESVQAVVFSMSQARLLPHLASVDEALVDAASDPNYKNNQDRKTFYMRLGMLKEQHEVGVKDVQETALRQMSEEELRQLALAGEAYDDDDVDA